MSKKLEISLEDDEAQAFEIIELAIDDLNLLTEAFNLINEVCQEVNEPTINLDPLPAKIVMN